MLKTTEGFDILAGFRAGGWHVTSKPGDVYHPQWEARQEGFHSYIVEKEGRRVVFVVDPHGAVCEYHGVFDATAVHP